MKKILVPTDFSNIAANAFRFAQRLAAEEEAIITVMHAHHPSFDYTNPYLDLPAQEFEKIKKDMLNDFLEEHTSTPQEDGGVAVLPTIRQEIRIGFAAEEITRASKEADLVIMGTTGEGNLLEKVFGSVSTYVSSHAKCPVLLVPGNCQCRGFNNVVYASNNIEADKIMLEQVFSLVKSGPAEVHFVHVDKEELEGQEYIVRSTQFEEAVRKSLPTVGFNTVSISCEDVQKGIVQYASDIRADLIVTATTHKSFLERLFHKSVTRDVVFHTTIPLMVLHYDH